MSSPWPEVAKIQMLLLPPYPLKQETCMTVCEPSSCAMAVCKCVRVYGCVLRHCMVMLCAH